MTDTPDDAKALYEALHGAYAFPWDALDETGRARYSAAIAASDRVRMERAGDVVERLTQNCVYLERSFPVLASVPGTEISRKGWESIQAGGRDMQIAAHLITTLRAALSEAQAERDAARVTALREAAHKATSFLVGDPFNGIPLHSPSPHEISAAILALIPTETPNA